MILELGNVFMIDVFSTPISGDFRTITHVIGENGEKFLIKLRITNYNFLVVIRNS